MASFVSIEIQTDKTALFERFVGAMQEHFPGWEPADGNLEAVLGEGMAGIEVDLAAVAVDVPAEVFHAFGEKIVNVPPHAAAPATAETTWTMVDTAGYTIQAGTLVGIQAAGDQTIGFEVATDVTVAPGQLTTAIGEVALIAVEAGAVANGLEADPGLIDNLAFVASIALEQATSGGADAEDPNDYLDRLAAEMQLLGPHVVLPRDVEVWARRHASVARATAIDGYDAVAETFNNEKTVTVAVIDEAGQALSQTVKDEVLASLEAVRELNFVYHVIDPTYTVIDVSFDTDKHEGSDPAAVNAATVQVVTDYLSPENWGHSPFDDNPGVWRNVDTVRRFELISLVDRVEGVDVVNGLSLAVGGGVLGTADVPLDGPAGLPSPGTITAN